MRMKLKNNLSCQVRGESFLSVSYAVYVCIIHSATFVIISAELPVNTSVISANHMAATPGIKAGRH